jgi:hypothetical protein
MVLTNIFYGLKEGVRLRVMCWITKTGCSHVAKGDQCVKDEGFAPARLRRARCASQRCTRSITCLFYFNHIASSGKLHNKAQVVAEAQPRQEEPR